MLETDTRLQLLVSNMERLINAESGDVIFEAKGNQIRAHSLIGTYYLCEIMLILLQYLCGVFLFN